MAIDDLKVVKDPHTGNYAKETTSDNEIGGHAMTPDVDDDTEATVKKAGMHPETRNSE